MKRFRKAGRPGQPALVPSDTALGNPAQRPLSIAPEELQGAALRAVELAAGGAMASNLSGSSTVDLRTSGEPLGIAPPDKGNTVRSLTAK